MVLKRLFQRGETRPSGPMGPSVRGHPPRLPQGVRVYAIGDIHGRADLLARMHAMIEADRRADPSDRQDFLVYLGDYVDRGFESRRVLDLLLDEPPEDATRVLLIGNHDLWFREFLKDPTLGVDWVKHGGDATLLSYGARLDLTLDEAQRFRAAQAQALERVPERHVELLHDLELAFSLGDYFFVHAGIRPGVPLEQQTSEDMLWIREPFLGHAGELTKVVVHGHTVEAEPVTRRHRVGIDTGACYTGRLTCLVLEGEQRRFLTTEAVAPAPARSTADR